LPCEVNLIGASLVPVNFNVFNIHWYYYLVIFSVPSSFIFVKLVPIMDNSFLFGSYEVVLHSTPKMPRQGRDWAAGGPSNPTLQLGGRLRLLTGPYGPGHVRPIFLDLPPPSFTILDCDDCHRTISPLVVV
jgi:hypothetical protein